MTEPIAKEGFSNKLEYLLTQLSYAVGLGNLWRFPYLVYSMGGGAFLLPYFIMLITVGLPFFLIETSLGQYTSEGAIKMWKICPLFKGIGIAMVTVQIFVGTYYNMIVGWSLYYLYASIAGIFQGQLPWKECNPEWKNFNVCENSNPNISRSASDLYFHDEVLNISDDIKDLGTIELKMAISLLIAWVLIFLILCRGVKGVGKVAYFTAIFPYIVITILIGYGATLEGAGEGIKYYLSPQWEDLQKADVWAHSAMQIFFSLSICTGGVITLASHNNYKNDFYRDTFFIVIANSCTSLYGGFAIFCFLGNMAHVLEKDVKDVATDGPGLAFVAYPAAMASIDSSPLAITFSIIFFLMLITLGMGSEIAIIETIVSTIVEQNPSKLRPKRIFILIGVCCTMFCGGLFLCSSAGMYILKLMDNYSQTYAALIIAFTEVVVLCWIYGVDRFLNNIYDMLERYYYARNYWKYLWKYVSPTIILAILIFTFIQFKPLKYGEIPFPVYTEVVGLLITLTSVSAIPIYAIVKIYKSKNYSLSGIKELLKPEDDWNEDNQFTHDPNDYVKVL